jgi:hypothetical protein
MKTQASEWVSILKRRAKFYACCFPPIFFLGLNLTANIYSSFKYTHFQKVFFPLKIL